MILAKLNGSTLADPEIDSMETAEKPIAFYKDPRLIPAGLAIALLAFLLALGANQGLKRFLALPEGESVETVAAGDVAPVAERRSRSRDKPTVASKRSYVDPILRRNIFDSSAVGATSNGDVDDTDRRRTDLKVTLLATVVADPETFSSCLIAIEEKNEEGTFGFGIGDTLLDEAEIIQIEQKRVIIRRTAGDIEYIDMDGEGAKRSTSRKSDDDDDDGISKSGDNSYVVDQSVIDEALSNIDALASQVRAIPHRGSDGEIDGFRLSAIRRGSLLHKLGIKNGDIVHSVNGQPLMSAAGAMSAYQSLQNERSFEFDLTRRNKKQTFDYTIR